MWIPSVEPMSVASSVLGVQVASEGRVSGRWVALTVETQRTHRTGTWAESRSAAAVIGQPQLSSVTATLAVNSKTGGSHA